MDPDNDDRRKRFFRLVGADDRRLANIHVRNLGEFSEQAALLFRDYLRAAPEARHRYEETKRTLAPQIWRTVDDYADAKGDCVCALIREAERCLGRRPLRRLALAEDEVDVVLVGRIDAESRQ